MGVSIIRVVTLLIILKLPCRLFTAQQTGRAQTQSSVLFDSDLSKLRPEDILDAFEDDDRRFRLVEQDTLTKPLGRIVMELGLAKSRGE